VDTEQLIENAISLPVEKRSLVIDCLLKSLNQPCPEVDKEWAELASKRVDELRSGKVEPLSSEEVLEKARDILKK
jgi:hypothetical protein